MDRVRPAELRLGLAGAAVVGVAFGMGRFTFGLTLPDLRADPSLTATGLPDPVLGLIAGGTFVGFLAGIVGAPRLAVRRGPRAPTTLGGACGVAGAATVTLASSPAVLAAGAVLAGSAAGWVWAPYSDLVESGADPPNRPRLLALISTGTSGGMVLVGAVAAVAGAGWRTVWAAVALCSAAAALLNVRWTPAREPDRLRRPPRLPYRRLAPPTAFAVTHQAACSISFTYTVEAVRRGGGAAVVGPLVFVLIGLVGLTALATGAMAARAGTRAVAVGCLVGIGGSLVVLAATGGSTAAALVSAVAFAPGYMIGAAVLAVWTDELVGHDPGRALTATMVVGALGAVGGPPLVGALTPLAGLPVLLGATGVATVLVGGTLAARR